MPFLVDFEARGPMDLCLWGWLSDGTTRAPGEGAPQGAMVVELWYQATHIPAYAYDVVLTLE